ncbi:nascent polypeptide-associated complex protein [Candidatus Woesearchaeota archaeon]|nr:nascent polypeptide-associated complex protein [Candidatus Woesearchaeota archaeon]
MQQLMRKMGVQQNDIEAQEVIIRTADKEIIIHNPSVAKVSMMGQQTYQVSGQEEVRERSSAPEISEEDVQAVVEQTGADADSARRAIEKHNGDLAEAILELQK